MRVDSRRCHLPPAKRVLAIRLAGMPLESVLVAQSEITYLS